MGAIYCYDPTHNYYKVSEGERTECAIKQRSLERLWRERYISELEQR
jgi:hypothetical protein